MKVIQRLLNVLKFTGMAAIVLIMLTITAGVVSRLLGIPVLGTVELAEIFHVVLIMFSFAYTQSLKEHISIDFLVERFPRKIQMLCSQIALLLLIAVCFLFGYIFLEIAMETTKTTLLLGIPHSFLKMIMMVGFVMWGIVALAQLITNWKSVGEEVTKDV